MTTSRHIKGLLAGVAATAVMGTAMAQGNPPNPAVKSAPVGAGQQSSQKTPMGETGTPANGPTSGSGSTGSSMGSTSNNGSTGSTSSMGSTGGGTSMGASSSSDASMASSSDGGRSSKRRMRADRN